MCVNALCFLRDWRAVGIYESENGKARAGQQDYFKISSFCRCFFREWFTSGSTKKQTLYTLRNFSRENFATKNSNTIT